MAIPCKILQAIARPKKAVLVVTLLNDPKPKIEAVTKKFRRTNRIFFPTTDMYFPNTNDDISPPNGKNEKTTPIIRVESPLSFAKSGKNASGSE